MAQRKWIWHFGQAVASTSAPVSRAWRRRSTWIRLACLSQLDHVPPAQQSGDVYVVVPPPAAYAPVQIAEMPPVYGIGYGEQAPNPRIGMF